MFGLASVVMCMSKDEIPIRTGIPPTSQLVGSDKFNWKSSFRYNDACGSTCLTTFLSYLFT
jgi:hypothetical protein